MISANDAAPAKKKKPLSEKQRESDEKLREELRNFDLRTFDKALDKAIKPKNEAANLAKD
jgi:hypothetical protein